MRAWVVSIGSWIGSGFTAACCVGGPAAAALLSVAGLGFLVHDAILIPFLLAFLGINLRAVFISSRCHGQRWLFLVSAVGVMLIVSGLWLSGAAVGAGLVLTLTASLISVHFSRQCRGEEVEP